MVVKFSHLYAMAISNLNLLTFAFVLQASKTPELQIWYIFGVFCKHKIFAFYNKATEIWGDSNLIKQSPWKSSLTKQHYFEVFMFPATTNINKQNTTYHAFKTISRIEHLVQNNRVNNSSTCLQTINICESTAKYIVVVHY